MNRKLVLLGAVGMVAGLIAACHGDNHGAPPLPPPPPPTSQSLDTAQVLSLARQASESTSPIPVNGGALVLNDTSETSAPIATNTM